MTLLPKKAANEPIIVTLEKGKTYGYCTCGLSATQPFCDSSHKGTDFKSLKFSCIRTETVKLCQCKQSKTSPYCDGTHKSPKD